MDLDITNITDVKINNEWEILTFEGYKDFKSIKRSITSKTIKLTLSNNEIFEGTPDHILIIKNNDRILKAAKENQLVTYKGTPINQ